MHRIPHVHHPSPVPLFSSACLASAYSHVNRALRVHWRSHLKEKPLVHLLSGCSSVCAKMWHLGRKTSLHIKKKVAEMVMGGQWSDKSTPLHRAPTKYLAATCLLPGVGRDMRPVSEWGGRLNDFTSPFQLQQLPIYIVMQIHGLSQMVLFQHRGCMEIWLFIPSTAL